MQPIKINTLIRKTLDVFKSNNSPIEVIPTGFQKLDSDFLGILRGEFIVLGGRPAMGKTQFALNLGLNISQNNSVLFYSFDNSEAVISCRLLSCITDVSMDKIMTNNLIKEESYKIIENINELDKLNFYLQESINFSLDELLNSIKEKVKELDLKVVIIDYLQLIDSKLIKNNRDFEMSFITRELKKIAQSLNIAIIAISQLSRSVEIRDYDKTPKLSDLRDSGSIEQVADKVWFLYRPEYYFIIEDNDEYNTPTQYMVKLIISKNRSGKTGVCVFKRRPNFSSFIENESDLHLFKFD